MKLIPEIWKDSDGWWCILKDGYQIDGCVGVREDTKKELLSRVRREAKKNPFAQR